MLKYIVTQKGGFMKVLGIIAEYNPFHNGHQYHIEAAKRQSGADAVVVVLSGNFTQRGEPALLEKHTRAQAALFGGADLVLELPSLFSAASAEYFAWGGISALHATGVVSSISFGMEGNSITPLMEVAQILSSEPPLFQEALKNALATGCSYPKARALALAEVTGCAEELLQQPNNILAIEYLKANIRLGNPFSILPIQRQGAGYHDADLVAEHYPSASALRNALHTADLSSFMPASAHALLADAILQGDISNPNALFLPIVTLLRAKPIEELQQLPYVSEGLEYRCKQAVLSSSSYAQLLDACSTVRYPRARIRRIFTSLLTGATAEDLAYGKETGIPYLRVLAFNEIGRTLLKEMKNAATLPIITKPAALHTLPDFASRVAQLESNATDVRSLTCQTVKPAGQDFSTTPLYQASAHS